MTNILKMHYCIFVFTVDDVSVALKQALSLGASIILDKGVIELYDSTKDKTVRVVNGVVSAPNGEVIEFLQSVNFE